jgi:uncharacterized membrane protein YdjX (TVP38/TMEM64 family)
MARGAPATPWAAILLRLAALAALFVGAALLWRWSAPHWQALPTLAPSARAALLVGAGAVMTALGAPRQAVAFAAGAAFGLLPALALALAAQLGGCALDYLWARLARGLWRGKQGKGRDGGKLGRLGQWRERLCAVPFRATLMLRLFPVGNNLLLNLAGGFLALPPLPFLAASLLGYLPQTLIFVLLARGARLGHGVEGVLSLILFLAATLAGYGLWRAESAAFAAPTGTIGAEASGANSALSPRSLE